MFFCRILYIIVDYHAAPIEYELSMAGTFLAREVSRLTACPVTWPAS